ncbi:MAG: hypothetical protein BroJett022_18820 [Actinomycetes bacterium]|nr:MAG: hypothetical protein BroJett022_18820 [Actinomycetes bacterium]
MSFAYESIGRLVVYVVRRRFGRQIRVAGGIALAGALIGGAIGAYLLASRDVEEG